MKRPFLFFLLVLVMSNIYASDWVWTSETKITSIYPAADTLNFTTEYANTSVSTCDLGKRFALVKSNGNYDAQVSAIMLAFATQKGVRLIFDGNQTPNCAAKVDRFIVNN